jgi:hypothetical protein
MYKWLRMGLFALPLVGGVAWAQGGNGSAGSAVAGSVTDDTRTPLQQKAGRIDDTTPAMPGDATKPADIPNTNPESDRSAMPNSTGSPLGQPPPGDTRAPLDTARPQPESAKPQDDTSKTEPLDKNDVGNKDQLNSDK